MAGQIQFNAATLGLPTFKYVEADLQSLGAYLSPWLATGTKSKHVAVSDVKIYYTGNTAPDATTDIEEYLKWGNCFFDVIIYKSGQQGITPRPRLPSDRSIARTVEEVASALAFQFFMILVRGSVSVSQDSAVGTSVPAFLPNVLKLTEAPKYYADILASFDLSNLDPAWVKSVRMGVIGKEMTNRLGLGVAGYRSLGPFKFLPRPSNLAPEYVEPYEVACSFVEEPMSWDLHPATRHPDVLSRYGPLNANLDNLALKIFDPVDLERLRKSRTIYAIPTYKDAVTQYLKWNRGIKWATAPASKIF